MGSLWKFIIILGYFFGLDIALFFFFWGGGVVVKEWGGGNPGIYWID